MNDRRSFVAVMMGSDSDWPVMQGAVAVLNRLEIEIEVRIASAHRTPAATSSYVEEASGRGCAVFIAGAGMAAHLAGAVAAHTTRPVIGVPLVSGPLAGMDALLSTVQMPSGFPVATVAVGKAGAANAGYLAAQILALSDPELAGRIAADREERARSVQDKDAALQRELGA
jgi:5-(carboxyamino)imidazole ribonucleotide mutase